jgi:osmotically-inducible protein OsmY
MTRPTAVALALGALTLLPGCVGGLVWAAATQAGLFALQERGLPASISDNAIRAEINHYWLQRDHEMHMRLTLQVWEGRVLIAGALPTESQRGEAEALARQAGGVREVINEVVVVPPRELGRFARDLKIEATIEKRLLFAKGIESINYSVEVVNGVVYLLGTASDGRELDRAITVIAGVPGVRRIVNHMLFRDDPRRFRTANASP